MEWIYSPVPLSINNLQFKNTQNHCIFSERAFTFHVLEGPNLLAIDKKQNKTGWIGKCRCRTFWCFTLSKTTFSPLLGSGWNILSQFLITFINYFVVGKWWHRRWKMSKTYVQLQKNSQSCRTPWHTSQYLTHTNGDAIAEFCTKGSMCWGIREL